MAILLLAEHDGTSFNDQTAKALTAATAIGGDVHVLVAGSNAKAAADAAAKAAARLIAERHDEKSDARLVDQAIKEIAGR